MDPLSPVHIVDDVRLAPGELSFSAAIGEAAPRRVWLRTDAPFIPNADAVLPICLMPAMRTGGTLRLPGSVSPRLLRAQLEYQAIQRVWSRDWAFGIPPLEAVKVEASARPRTAAAAPRGVATFFSGGVDSWSTALGHPDATHLIFVRGMDLLADRTELADEVEDTLRAAATELGRSFHVVDTNLRELSEPTVPWLAFFGCSLAAVALFMAPMFDRVLIAGDSDYEVMVNFGANPLVDHLWSTEDLEVVHDGGRFSRVERVRRIAHEPIVQQTLRVCWENRDGAYNCCRCRKCLMTMVTLEALGVRDRFSTFPADIDYDALASVEIDHEVLLTLWEDILDLLRAGASPQLEQAVADVVARGKQRLGLPADYRRRSASAPDLLGDAPAPDAEAASASNAQAALQDTLLNGVQRLGGRFRRRLAEKRARRASGTLADRVGSSNRGLDIRVIRTRRDLERARADASEEIALERLVTDGFVGRENWALPGICQACERAVMLAADWQFSDGSTPNFRERLVCPGCQLNNRQRFMTQLVGTALMGRSAPRRVYLYEQITPFYAWAEREIEAELVGSEYLGHDLSSGDLVDGVRHEDALAMSFSDRSFDVVVSNDVFEHVPDIDQALAESARILRPSGALLLSVPFHEQADVTVARAELRNGEVVELLPAEYHGNPVSERGSLVFNDLGWDLLDRCRAAGFRDAYLIGYHSWKYGYLGAGLQLVFVAER